MNHADRNLLFGILAVQMNFVARDDLIAAMHAWVLERSKPLGRILVAQQVLSPARHDLLEQLVVEHLVAHGGDAEKSLAATDGLDAIRGELELFADLEIQATLDRLPGAAAATRHDPEATLTYSRGSPAAGSRFSILRPHARGGLGQISVALDAELNREVALKELRPERAADPFSRARFLLEAEITGRLEHPGVVPVYGLGCDMQGRPFYAMRFVKGQSLNEAIDRFHAAKKSDDSDSRQWKLDLRQLLNRFIAVCNVMAYAHSRGVIHRDLKPANILLGPYGETLVVDWGLAKVVGRGEAASHAGAAEVTLQPGSGSSETLPGTVLGTPAYMSPEQAEGRLDQIGPLSDVYSLGATLYCLLTGKPPIDETDVGEALRRVQRGEFPSPRAVRPSIPPSLEAICVKAMAANPEDRYPTPRAVADEIEHWLADEPVSVFREPITVRLTRWGRRHRTLATSIGVLLIATVVGLAIATALIRREQLQTEGERLRAERSLVETKRQRKIAEDHALDVSRRAEDLRRKDYINRVNLAHGEILGDNVARALDLLDGCPQDLRGWEWEYVRRQCHLDLHTFRESATAVNAVAFSPDGRLVATGSGGFFPSGEPGDVVAREAASGREVFARRRLKGGVRSVAFSRDGRHIAAGHDHDLVVWELSTGRERFRWTDPGPFPILSLAFRPEGRKIAAGYGRFNATGAVGHARLFDSSTGKPQGEPIPGHDSGVWAVAFSPDSRQLALASAGLVEIRDLASRKPVLSLRGPSGYIYTVAFSPDGQRIAAGGLDRTIRIWDRATGSELRVLRGHEGVVRGVAFGPDSRLLASVAEDKTVKVWQATSDRELATFHGHQHFTLGVAFSPDGQQIASGSVDHTAKLWFAAPSLQLTRRFPSWITALAFSPDGRGIASGTREFPYGPQADFWDPITGESVHPLPPSNIWSIAFSPDGRRIATTGNAGLRIWDAATGQLVTTLQGPAARGGGLLFGPDGKTIQTADDRGVVRIWDAATGRKLSEKPLPVQGLTGNVAFSSDGHRIALGRTDRTVTVHDCETGRELFSLRGHQGPIGAVAFSPDGRKLASVGGIELAGLGEVKVWDATTGRAVGDLRGHTDIVKCVAFSPDGRRLATSGDDRVIKLWDTDTLQEVFSLRGHTAGVLVLAFSPDGRRLASGGIDLSVRIWDPAQPGADQLLRRVALPLVEELFRNLMLKGDVLDHIRHDPSLRGSLGAMVLQLAERSSKNPGLLNNTSWSIVVDPDRSPEEYRRAMRYAEAACRLVPQESTFVNTLGVARYRAGRYREALVDLNRSLKLNAPRFGGPIPADLAFVAMAQHRLGQAAEARKTLEQLRDVMKNQRWSVDYESKAFLIEASALIDRPKGAETNVKPSTKT